MFDLLFVEISFKEKLSNIFAGLVWTVFDRRKLLEHSAVTRGALSKRGDREGL